MKFYESHFDEYIKSSTNNLLHSTKIEINNINNLNNLIIYGPPGIGKYTQMLQIIKNLSPSLLKYEKKMVISYNKTLYYCKISDIHYEIDMSLLGCNAKLLWHEIYCQIVDIISSKNIKNGIIVCKYFQDIHTELLEIFYSYMQTNYNSYINIKFILITQDLSFIPDNILNCCKHIKYSRPSRSNYNKCFKIKLNNLDNLSLITNIKDIKQENLTIFKIQKKNKYNIFEPYKIICNKLIEKIININDLKYLIFRDILYDICIFDLNIVNCIWYILYTLINKNLLDAKKLNRIIIETYNFFKLYNNNYRPIYHLEKYILYIIVVVHELS
jgi:hypothetical protein